MLNQQALLNQLAPKNTGITGVGRNGAGMFPAMQTAEAPEAVMGAQEQASRSAYSPAPAGDLSMGVKENRASQIGALSGAASGASTGASVGSVVPVLGTLAGAGIGAGVGAIKGWAQGRTNNTSNEREKFAQSVGAKDSTDLWSKLQAGTSPEVASELQTRALNRIGKHDETANAQWMQDVQSAFAAGKPAGFPGAAPAAAGTGAAPAGATPGAPTAAGGGGLPPGPMAPTGGDAMQAKGLYDNAKQTPEQAAAFQRDTQAYIARDKAGAAADQANMLADGTYRPGYQQYQSTGGPDQANYGNTLIGGQDFPGAAPGGAGGDLGSALRDAGVTGPDPNAAPGPAGGYGKTVGQYGSRLEGFNSDKLNSDHASPKYLIGRTISNFDPRKGVTPEVLTALNSLGIGQFSGSGDKVTIANGDPRFEGVNAIDLVRGFKDPGGTGGWQFGAENTNAPQPADGAGHGGGGTGGGGLPAGGLQMDALLSGDPLAKIKAAMGQFGGQRDNLNALMAQLKG